MRRYTLAVLKAGLAGALILTGPAGFGLPTGLAGPGPVAAQGLGFLFGEPPPRVRRASRPRPAATIAVPLPVPRPHFPGDDAPVVLESAKPAAPPDVAGPAASTPPLPPERPPNLPAAGTAAPATDTASSLGKDQGPPPPAPAEPSRPEPSKPEPATQAKAASPASVPAAAAPMPPEKPAELGTGPAVAPSGATTAFNPREPAADLGCADRLNARGVVAEIATLGPQPDARCTVVQPMRLASESLPDGSTVNFPDKPTIACVTADAFSAYVHDLLAPLVKGTWSTGVTSVWTGPGLECRSRDHIFGAKLSSHGQGLAVDIAQLKLGDGRLVAVGEPKTATERDFETAARAGGCGYFHTVLGPGSDSYHRTHWHFDLEVRGKDGDGKFCK